MLSLLTIIQIVLLSVLGFFLMYLAFLTVFSLKGRSRKRMKVEKTKKFAVVVPAYNEAKTISRTLQNLIDVDYPEDLFDVIVIADNCTDNTAEISRNEGVIVYERDNPDKRGKGYALRWCFDKLLAENDKHYYDAMVVVDADSIVTHNLLTVMNKYLRKGAKVVQGYLTVEPKPGVWTTEIIRIGFTLYNYVRPLGQRVLGFPTGLRGNGMCFSVEALRKVPWDAYSTTEDLEYGLKLLLNEVDVVFAPEAIGYNVVPENAQNAESQRERWEMGRIPVLKKYFGKLLKALFSKRSFKVFDALVNLVTPPLVNMMLFVVMMAAVSLILVLTGVQSTMLYFWLWMVLFGMGLFHALAGLYAADADRSLYKSLIYVPRYALWKLYLYGKVIFVKGTTTEWVRTVRED